MSAQTMILEFGARDRTCPMRIAVLGPRAESITATIAPLIGARSRRPLRLQS